MPLVPAKDLLTGLRDLIAGLTLAESGSTEPLFERVEIYANKRLGEALSDLIITKGRVCLIVPTGLHRVRADSGGGRVLVQRWLDVDVLIGDRAYYRAGQKAVAGSDNNLGTIEMAERLEQALEGQDLSAWGEAVLLDGAPFELSAQEAPGREAWIQSLQIPAGDVRTETF